MTALRRAWVCNHSTFAKIRNVYNMLCILQWNLIVRHALFTSSSTCQRFKINFVSHQLRMVRSLIIFSSDLFSYHKSEHPKSVRHKVFFESLACWWWACHTSRLHCRIQDIMIHIPDLSYGRQARDYNPPTPGKREPASSKLLQRTREHQQHVKWCQWKHAAVRRTFQGPPRGGVP